MLLAAPALKRTSPAGFIGLLILRGIVALLIGSALHGIESSGLNVYAGISLPPARCSLLRPLLTPFYRLRGKGSPQVRTRCFTAQPPHLPPRLNRSTSLCCASSSARVGLMRFLFIGSLLSHSLPSPGWLPFRSWPLVVIIFMFPCFGSLTGDFHPIYNAPMLGAHNSPEDNPG